MNQRVWLVPAARDDVERIVAMKNDPALWPYEYDIPREERELREAVSQRIDTDGYRQYVLRLGAEDGDVIGELHIHTYDPDRGSWELGYVVLPPHRGHGYCREAARMALSYAFERWGAHKVVAMCNARNAASRRVLESIGMTLEGVFREELPHGEAWDDQLFWSMLDREWTAGGGVG